MSISKSTFALPYYSSLFLILIGCLAVQKISAASLAISKPDYSLTYQDGWAISSLGVNSDTSYALINFVAGFSAAGGTGLRIEAGKTAGDYVDQYSKLIGNDFSRSDSTSKTIGAYTFIVLTYTDAKDATKKIKVYATTKGDFAFVSYIYYPLAQVTVVTAQEEAALTTLKILATTGIRFVNPNKSNKNLPGPAHRGYDLRGRRLILSLLN